ncbi:MAG: HEAT repeat domain-containing protein [Pirellulaceae bacterium]
MDTRNSVLIVAAYVVGGIVVAGVGLGYFSWRQAARLQEIQARAEAARLDQLRANPGSLTGPYAAAAARGRQSLAELKSALTATRDRLDKSTAALNRKNQECQELKEELDNSFMLLLSLISDESDPTATPERPAMSRGTREKLDTELERLRLSLVRSETLDSERQRQLEMLQRELAEADLELSMMQEEARRVVEGLTAEKQVLEDASIRVIGPCGILAVPRLIEYLKDERVEVRRWSARALGAVGPEAIDARPFLRELLADPDEDVRRYVQTALSAIGGPAAP